SPRDLTALSRRAAGVLATWTLLGGSCRGCFASKAHRTWRASRPQDAPAFLTRSRAPERSPSRVHPNRRPRRRRGCQQLDRPAPARARKPEDTMRRTARRSVAIAGATSLVALGALALPAQAATADGASLSVLHGVPDTPVDV